MINFTGTDGQAVNGRTISRQQMKAWLIVNVPTFHSGGIVSSYLGRPLTSLAKMKYSIGNFTTTIDYALLSSGWAIQDIVAHTEFVPLVEEFHTSTVYRTSHETQTSKQKRALTRSRPDPRRVYRQLMLMGEHGVCPVCHKDVLQRQKRDHIVCDLCPRDKSFAPPARIHRTCLPSGTNSWTCTDH